MLINLFKKKEDYCICIDCFIKVREALRKSKEEGLSQDFIETYINLLKLQKNPNMFFEKIYEEINNQELDLSRIDRNHINEDDEKMLESILEIEEKISNLENENFILQQSIEKDKNKFINVVSNLFENDIIDKNNIENTVEQLNDDQKIRKNFLLHLLSLVNTEKIFNNYKAFIIFPINNEWGKVLLLTQILSTLLKISLEDYEIYSLGCFSYFTHKEKKHDLTESINKTHFDKKSKELLEDFYKLLDRFTTTLSKEPFFIKEPYSFTNCIENILLILNNIIINQL